MPPHKPVQAVFHSCHVGKKKLDLTVLSHHIQTIFFFFFTTAAVAPCEFLIDSWRSDKSG